MTRVTSTADHSVESGDAEAPSGGGGGPIRQRRILVTALPGCGEPVEIAAWRACDAVGSCRGAAPTAVVVEFDRRPRPATVLASRAAKELEERLAGAVSLSDTVTAKARGGLVFATINTGPNPGRIDDLAALPTLLALLPDAVPACVAAPDVLYRQLLENGMIHWDEVLIRGQAGARSGPGQDGSDPLRLLVAGEAGAFADRVELTGQAPGRIRTRRALAGKAEPSAEAAPRSGPDGAKTGGWRRLRRAGRAATGVSGEGGQATPLVLGAAFVLVLGAIAMVMLGGAITGKARGQRAADLAALSAVRSMQGDLPRLMAPPTLPNGAPNPYHMPKPVYLARARLAAVGNATANGSSPLAVSVRFPDAASWAPVRARVAVGTTVRGGDGGGSHRSSPVWAEARLSAPVSMGAVPRVASGGGYSGPLAERQGRGLRPDVAIAFDAMAAAAANAGVSLAINSAFRSDAEQARLFAANPDPRMVARPGTSLHRCGTELDLGPPGAYGWLAANAGRFGFTQRYSWEAWHYGFSAGPAPCSNAGNRTGGALAGGTRGGEPRKGLNRTLPGFVPARYRRPILAAAMRWNVSAALLAAQLYAESGFDPNAGSSAGAQGIAQFMPATAAQYGLRDPFDPDLAIMAQAHLMSDLLRQFGSPALALAAYNAGPGAVSPCNCIPPYAETQAYVAKILAMLGGAGAIAPMPMEIELVA